MIIQIGKDREALRKDQLEFKELIQILLLYDVQMKLIYLIIIVVIRIVQIVN